MTAWQAHKAPLPVSYLCTTKACPLAGSCTMLSCRNSSDYDCQMSPQVYAHLRECFVCRFMSALHNPSQHQRSSQRSSPTATGPTIPRCIIHAQERKTGQRSLQEYLRLWTSCFTRPALSPESRLRLPWTVKRMPLYNNKPWGTHPFLQALSQAQASADAASACNTACNI